MHPLIIKDLEAIDKGTPIARPAEVTAMIRLWVLRILVPLGGQQMFVEDDGFNKAAVAAALGLAGAGTGGKRFSPRSARSELRKLHTQAESKRRSFSFPAQLQSNIAKLGELAGLDSPSRQILGFMLLMKNDPVLNEAVETLGPLSTVRAFHALSVILGISEPQVRRALDAAAPLSRSGLLQVDRDSSYTMENKFNLLSSKLADVMIAGESDPLSLLKDTVRASPVGTLCAGDYRHLGSSYDILKAYLRNAVDTRSKGANVLLHGVPGTGKSELARLMARELGCALMEVATEDEDGDPTSGVRRLRSYRAAQAFFAHRPTLLLFDEMEDVFNDTSSLYGERSSGQVRKGWINQALEENVVPTLWLTNAVDCLDPAFIRRFDIVLKLSVPPKAARKEILAVATGDLLDAASIERLSNVAALSPAIVTRAATVTRALYGQVEGADARSVMERLIDGTLEAQGHAPLRQSARETLPGLYDPEFINVDVDLAGLAGGLSRSGSGRLCFYGPSGTGKTAYGRWLAGRLNRPLVAKRGSDLLSMWVGGTEKAIAEAFAEATAQQAILLIDEIDGFLQDRRGAQRNWELTQVNELLTQMEVYDGILIATTNLMDGMDQAALRRFDVKARFDYLTNDQAFALLARHCTDAALPAPSASHKILLRQLPTLTPGDFAAVARRGHFLKFDTSEAWIAALEEECRFKDAGRPRIGFRFA